MTNDKAKRPSVVTSRLPLFAKISRDIETVAGWSTDLVWASDWFGENFLESIKETYKDNVEKCNKLGTMNTILTSILILYLSGIKFDIQISGLRVQQFPGLTEILVIVTSFLGVQFSSQVMTAIAFSSYIDRYVKGIGIPFFSELLKMRFGGSSVLNFLGSSGSIWQFKRPPRLTMILAAIPFVAVALSCFSVYSYAQFIGIRFMLYDSQLPRFVTNIAAALAILMDFAAVYSFVLYFAVPFPMYANPTAVRELALKWDDVWIKRKAARDAKSATSAESNTISANS